MSDKKVIAVIGVTGRQGGAVASTFLSDPKLKDEWVVRGVVRDPSKEAAKKLAEQGAEIVVANLDDKESLVRAMTGAYAAFGVTNYWEKADMQYEIQQGKNLADAAKEAGVQHYIWSSLDNVKKRSNGKLQHVYHFDSKAIVEDYVRELGIPATFFLAGFFLSNIPGDLMTLTPTAPGGPSAWTLAMPAAAGTPIPTFHTGDTGKYAKAIVRNRAALLGRRFLGASAYVAAQDIVGGFARAFPEEAAKKAAAAPRFLRVPDEVARDGLRAKGSPEYVVQEVFETVLLMQDFGYFFGEPLEGSLRYVEDPLTDWEQYCKSAEAFKGLK